MGKLSDEAEEVIAAAAKPPEARRELAGLAPPDLAQAALQASDARAEWWLRQRRVAWLTNRCEGELRLAYAEVPELREGETQVDYLRRIASAADAALDAQAPGQPKLGAV